ncbi:MAG: amidophosphoribosyltransferase [Xanthomonadales bacterium]|nr:amidophosphoribosyltransferase [Xanthomonadales bacterium]
MCGIVGIVGHYSVASVLHDALTALQHRGQDAAGIATLDERKIHLYKANGLVKDVFSEESLLPLTGNVGIAHVRYPTAGCSHSEEAQPMYVNSPYGIALAHNGNLINKDALKKELFETDRRHLNTESDSEVLLNILAHEIQHQNPQKLRSEHLFKAVEGVHKRCGGGYASIALIPTFGVVGFRDLSGIRPAVLGKRESERGTQYAIASESVALDVIGFETVRDLRPGETIVLTLEGQLHSHTSELAKPLTPCIFEYVYFARPDSMMDDISVYKARLRMGEALARKIQRLRPEHDIDVVIPVPDTSRTSALPMAYELNVKYREGFIKNRYIGRTFIMPGQEERQKSVKRKLNPISLEFRNKNVLLVDDSIVRGTTSRQIIQMARDAGARKVYLASAAPPVRYPNVYGIDMPAATELIAHAKTEAEIQAEIGADWLIYQDLDDLIDACRDGNPAISEFDTSCFSGEYITGLEEGYLQKLELQRSDQAKLEGQKSSPTVV